MSVRLIGPLEVDTNGSPVTVGGPRMRRLLGSLALGNGEVRSTDALIEAVWAETEPPEGARRTVMSYISRLRHVLGENAIEQIEHGYRFDRSLLTTDVEAFDDLVVAGRRMFQAGNHPHAIALFDEALALWRGDPLGEFEGEIWAEADRIRLLLLRLSTLEGRFAAKIDLGECDEILADLGSLADDHPEREHLQYLHMLALYRSGQQTAALSRYESTRRALAEMGLEPSPDLRELEHRILTHAEPVRDHEPRTGGEVRGFLLGDRLGEGSFGTIYQATQPSVGRDVAVKVIRPELANDPQFVRRFETEAQLVARLEHPHIVPLYDYWREPGGAYLVMRLLRGGTAEDRLVMDGPMPVADVARLVEEIGGALAAAHARGVIHRDVKPANILFDEDGASYLADFGIAREGDDRRPADLRSAGSPLYASPEQVQGGASSAQSDIYSLGVTVYELLAGRSAFADDSMDALMKRKLTMALPPISPEYADLSDSIDAVLARATAVNAADRFDNVAAFVLAFQTAAAITPSATRTGEPVPATLAPTRAAASATLVSLQLTSLNPYKGLQAFREADAQDFYGRDVLIDELVDRVRSRRLVAVVGASGSGKSSLVRAGLVPALADQRWFVTTIVPGSHPFEELEDGLLRVATDDVPGLHAQLSATDRGLVRAARRVLPPDGSELLIVIDQFEEVFTLAGEADRARFLAALVQAITDERSRVRVIVTVRADFFDRPLRDRDFGVLLQDATVNVLPLSREELISAIERPATRLGVGFEPGLVDAIIADVGESAGALPLLQYALTELFDHRAGGQMTLADYRDIGGVTGALAQRADEVYAGLPLDGQDGARRLFTRLVTPGDGVEDTRRRALRSEMTICRDEVIDAFGDRRLLAFDHDPATRAPTVEVAHEALIREWQRLRGWLDDDREGLRILRHLTSAARGWLDSERDPGELYRGMRLDAACEWSVGRENELAPAEAEFLEASMALRESEREEAEQRAEQKDRQNRRLRRSLLGLAAVTVLTLVATSIALQQRSSAQREAAAAAVARGAAETRRLVSDVPRLAPTNRRVAFLLAVEAYRREPGPDSLGAVKDALANAQHIIGYIGADIAFRDLAWTGDGRVIGVSEGGIVVLGLDSERQVEIAHTGARELAVRPDDAVVAIASNDQTVRIFDLTDGAEIEKIDGGSSLNAITFSGDGRWLAAGDRDGTIRLFDSDFEPVVEFDAFDDDMLAAPGDVAEPLAHEPLTFREGAVDVAFSSDGTLLAAIGGASYVVYDTSEHREIVRGAVTRTAGGVGERLAAPTGVGFTQSETAELLAVTTVTSTIVVEPTTGREVERWPFPGAPTSVVVAQDLGTIAGRRAVTVGRDGRIRVASRDSSDAIAIDAQFGAGTAIAADPAGERVAVGGEQGALIVSLVGRGPISWRIMSPDTNEFGVSLDGSAVVGSDVSTAATRMWRRDGDVFRPEPLPEPVGTYLWTGMPFGMSWDENTLTAQLRDPNTMVAIGQPVGPHGAINPAMSNDARLIALGGSRRTDPNDRLTVAVYEASTGESVALLDDFANEASILVRSLSFTPDDQRLIVATDDGRAVMYDTATWAAIEPALAGGNGAVVQATFNRDGSLLATVAADGSILLRDPSTYQPTGPPLLGNTDAVEGFSFGPFFSEDGRWMFTMTDGDVRMFDVDARVLVGSAFPFAADGGGGAGRNARFAATATDDGAIVWDLDVDRWPEIACQVAGRNLTAHEWEQFGPADAPYQATCAQWPSLADQPSTTGGES